jgi:hypothetical protein
MGFIRENEGLMSIETRRESVVIHADYDVNTPLGRAWLETVHPEIEYKDIPDLIRALVKVLIDNPVGQPPNPRWHQDDPQMQLVSLIGSLYGHAENAKQGVISPEVGIERTLAHCEELLALAATMKGQAWWPEPKKQ